jgi:hypothetical protein
MAAPQGTAVRGGVGRPPPHGVGHPPRRRLAAKLDFERLKAGVARLPDRQLLQVSGALRASRRKPVTIAEAIPRWQSHYSDSMGEGGTHMLQKARLSQLIQCVILCDKRPKLIIRCHTASQQDLVFRPSLAPHDGRRAMYPYFRRCFATRPCMAAIAGADHAA